MSPANAPKRVPIVHPEIGGIIKPYIYLFPTLPLFDDATAKTSSVLAKDKINLSKLFIVEPSFCEREIDINAYLELITSCVIASSMIEPCAQIIGTPANCPADVRLHAEIKKASRIFKPLCIEKIPKAKATEK